MPQIVEHRHPEVWFGWFFLILFWIFNALMALWAFLAAQAVEVTSIDLRWEIKRKPIRLGLQLAAQLLVRFYFLFGSQERCFLACLCLCLVDERQ